MPQTKASPESGDPATVAVASRCWPSKKLTALSIHESRTPYVSKAIHLPHLLPPFILVLVATSQAATLYLGDLTTTWPGPPASAVHAEATTATNLSDLTGLIPGHDIEITVSIPEPIFWLGQFYAAEGDLTLNYQANLTIGAGTFSNQSVESWSFGPIPWTGGQSPGYDTGPSSSLDFSLTVPWGTDLSFVTFTLADLSSISAVEGVLESSAMELHSATITTTSSAVPEPGAALLGVLSSLLLLRRKRE